MQQLHILTEADVYRAHAGHLTEPIPLDNYQGLWWLHEMPMITMHSSTTEAGQTVIMYRVEPMRATQA